MVKSSRTTKRRAFAAALLCNTAVISNGFVLSPGKLPYRTSNIREYHNGIKSQQRSQPLSFWKKDVDVAEETAMTFSDESSAPWFFFPGEGGKAPVDVEEASSVGTGRLNLIMVQTQQVLSPAATVLDEVTDGWALSYADLSPESETTPVGQAFLATNIAYAAVGILLGIHGETLLGFLTECASVASFVYHYTQLQASTNRANDGTVRLALMIDYVFAVSSILLATLYLVLDHQLPPMEGVVSGGIGIACLLACWVWEQGLAYIVLHSLWHLFSAYCGYIVGSAHIGA